VTPETEVRAYSACVSCLIVTFRFASPPILPGTSTRPALTYTLLSLLLGWWGIPWGPIYTVASLVRNVRGGYKLRIGELLPEKLSRAEG